MKVKLTFIIMLLCISGTLFAQSYDAQIVDRTVDGIVAVTNIVVSDTFTPMTHYQGGVWTMTAVGAYMSVDRLYDDPELKGDGLSGIGWGLGGGYALSRSLMIYAIYSGMTFDGNITGRGYDGLAGIPYSMSADYSLHSLFAGMGFDVLGGNERWSLPVYAGFGLERYDVNILFPFSYSSMFPPVSYQHNADISGSGFLYGFTLAAALSGKIWRMQITPYVLFYRTFNKPDLNASVHQSAPVVNDFSYAINAERISIITPGLQISGMITPGLSVTASVGGFIASKLGLNDNEMSHGLKANALALGISYRGSGD